MNASFEEKSVWVTLLSMLVAFGFYLFVASQMLQEEVTSATPYLPILGISVVILVGVLTIGHIAVAVVNRPEGRDERDRLIAWKAENYSSWVLGLGVIAAIFGLTVSLESAWIANGLLVFMYLSEVLKHILQIYYYRRGV